MRDPYDILGVGRSATQDEIKAAFRKLAGQHHPDKNPDDPEAQQRFKEINAAHEILKDPQKRAAFDRFGERGVDGAPGAGFDFSNLEDLFGDLLGALGLRSRDKGNIKREVKITFEECAFGCEKEITYERQEPCGDCAGSGAAAGSSVARCDACGGRGKVRQQQGMIPIAIERPCGACGGSGRVISVPCVTCQGVSRE